MPRGWKLLCANTTSACWWTPHTPLPPRCMPTPHRPPPGWGCPSSVTNAFTRPAPGTSRGAKATKTPSAASRLRDFARCWCSPAYRASPACKRYGRATRCAACASLTATARAAWHRPRAFPKRNCATTAPARTRRACWNSFARRPSCSRRAASRADFPKRPKRRADWASVSSP